MGYSSVGIISLDVLDAFHKSPKAFIAGLAYPPMSNNERCQQRWKEYVRETARREGEPSPDFDALKILGSEHSSTLQCLIAWHGALHQIFPSSFGYDEEHRATVTLVLPERHENNDRNTCPKCHRQDVWLRRNGVLYVHKPGNGHFPGEKRCPGSGHYPTTPRKMREERERRRQQRVLRRWRQAKRSPEKRTEVHQSDTNQ